MKNQESLDKQLKEKLAEAEVTPPALLFDNIMDEVSTSRKERRPLWYVSVLAQRIAASVAILAVAAVAWLSWPAADNSSQERIQLSSVDSFTHESIEKRLRQSDQEAIRGGASEVENMELTVQPKAKGVRLATMKAESAAQIITSKRELETVVAPIQPLPAIIPAEESLLGEVYEAPQQYAMAPEVTEELSLNDFVLPSLRDTYSILSDRKILSFAKNKFDEFATKEHYLSFNLGNIEFGQTIQLSKKENEN